MCSLGTERYQPWCYLGVVKNIIDINACDRLPDFEQAERIGRAAREIAQADYGWDQLVAQLRPAVRV